MTVLNPTGNNELLGDAVAMRKIGRLERFLGPDNYRVVQGLFKTPAAIAGTVLIAFFVLIALLAPVLAPPATDDPYKIPRDGFKAEPKAMGEVWKSRPPPLPFWWKAVTGKDEWVHIFGTAQGQYDIYYGVIWGTRTAFKTGLAVVISTVLIGVIVGAVSAYYGGFVDNILMRIVDVLYVLPSLMATLILAAVLTPVLGRTILPVMIR
jgi:peptide/nickel transport system permease protein